jgi:formyltetrahydrofolate deformylase
MSANAGGDGGLVLTLSCPDQTGIVHAIAGALAAHNWNIDDSQQFADHATRRFFMRVETSATGEGATAERAEALRRDLTVVATRFAMELSIHDRDEVPSVLVLVSRAGHCLNDLLYRQSNGSLRCAIGAVVSNHTDCADLARRYGVDFHHLPVSPATRAAQEEAILGLVEELGVSLVVLARYMQILSPAMVERLSGRAINIHHSFLPSFKGARPYHQAYERGVKLIGATAHYVTSDLDEGPIIEQEVIRVDHRMSPTELVRRGEELECRALGRAVEWHLSHRVMRNGNRTVVFA